ncbi:MAG: acyl carrier protein [Nitrospirota bacterium]
MATDIAARIQQALAEYLKRDVHTIDPRDSLRDDLGLDSMATIELLFRIEEAFDLQIPDEDLQHLRTVADVIHYVEGRLNQPQPDEQARPAKKAAGSPKPKRPAAKKKG